jgi:hypothetical protein
MIPRPLPAQGGGGSGAILEIPATARALGLGNAYVAVVGDEGSVFVNPAGMAPVRRIVIGGSFEEDFLGARYTSAAGVMRVGRFDVGLGAALLQFGGDSVVVPAAPGSDFGTPTGATIEAFSFLGVGALAYRRGMISLGASGKFLRQSISDGGGEPVSSNGVTGDAGFAIAVFDIMALGMVVQNVAGSMTGAGGSRRLPRTTRAGLTINFVDPQGTLRLMTTTDWISPPGGDSHWVVALEGGAIHGGVGVVGRAGVAMGRARTDRQPISFGAGLVFPALRLDWGYQGWGATGESSHRFGLRWIL